MAGSACGEPRNGYPDNPAGPDTCTRRHRVDYVVRTRGLSTIQSEIRRQPDWSNDNLSVDVGTSDDAAVRPSDHNFIFAVLPLRE